MLIYSQSVRNEIPSRPVHLSVTVSSLSEQPENLTRQHLSRLSKPQQIESVAPWRLPSIGRRSSADLDTARPPLGSGPRCEYHGMALSGYDLRVPSTILYPLLGPQWTSSQQEFLGKVHFVWTRKGCDDQPSENDGDHKVKYYPSNFNTRMEEKTISHGFHTQKTYIL